MGLDLASLHGMVVNEITAKCSLRESMDRVIGACSFGRPHHDWDKLRALPYENGEELREWIERPFRLDPPTATLAGLWFGLFNPVYDGKPVADIYVCGSRHYDPNPDDNSWAAGPDWWPEHRYAKSAVLRRIYEIAYGTDGLGNDAEYPLCLAYGGLAIRDLLRSVNRSLILGAATSVGVTVGFDSGDFVLLGNLTKQGLGL